MFSRVCIREAMRTGPYESPMMFTPAPIRVGADHEVTGDLGAVEQHRAIAWDGFLSR